MKQLAYGIVITLGTLLALPFLVPKLLKGRYRNSMLKRLGLRFDAPENARSCIWLHAMSLGEARSAAPLVKSLRERIPRKPLVVSASTRQGRQTIDELFGGMDGVYTMTRPMDLPWAVGVMIKRLKPSLAILVEGDIWPGWQWSLEAAGVPRMLVNSRVSPRTYASYKRFRPFARLMLSGFDTICAQTGTDQGRLDDIGPRADIRVVGNLKFDSAGDFLDDAAKDALASELGLAGRDILVAGSTHGGEEEGVLRAFVALKADYPDLCLLLAPRETERGREVAAMAKALGMRTCRLSGGRAAPDTDVVVLDMIGILARAYALGRAAFVGGSWVKVGGHNLLEPAAQAVPQVFGPVIDNFLEMSRGLIKAEAAVQVGDGRELEAAWRAWLDNPDEARRVGNNALEFCRRHQGAVERTTDLAIDLMKGNAT